MGFYNKISLIVIIIFLIIIFPDSSMATWPQENDWIPFIDSNWEYIVDPESDVNADYLDYVSVDLGNSFASACWYFDGNNIYFRVTLNGDPVKYKKGNPVELLPFGWNVLVDVTGDNYADYSVSIDGTGSSDRLHTEYNLDQDNTMDGETGYGITATQDPYLDEGYIYLINNQVRVKQITSDESLWIDGNPDYYLETKIPLAWLSRQNYSEPPAVTETSTLKFAAGSGASAMTINKDLVGQTTSTDISQDFSNFSSFTFEGSYGVLKDIRHDVNIDDYGLWYVKEEVELEGEGWPAGSSDYYTGAINVKIEDPLSQIVWEGSVPSESDGSILLNPVWYIESGDEPGVYNIYVEDPRNLGEYNLKDTFTFLSPVLQTSYKEVNLSTALPGERLDYMIGVINTGNYPANNIIVRDIFPEYTVYITDSTYLNGVLQSDLNDQSPLENGFIVGGLDPGSQLNITFSLNTSPDIIDQTQIDNIAIIRFDESPFERYQVIREAYTIVNSPQLKLIKSSSVSQISPSETITYYNVCENIGSSIASNVIILDQIPSDTIYQLNSITPDALVSGVDVFFRHEADGDFDQNEVEPVIALKWVFDDIQPGEFIETSFKVKVK